MTAAIIALIVNLGAYTTEIVRAGLEAIPKAQIEAGHSLGLSGLQVFRYVVMFPALKTMFPALASQFVLLMLATSVVSQISVDGSLPRRLDHPVAHLPRLRGLHRHRRALSRARARLPRRCSQRIYHWAFAGDDPRIRPHRSCIYLIAAARWTLRPDRAGLHRRRR